MIIGQYTGLWDAHWLHVGTVALAIFVAFDGQFDQAIQQLWIGQTTRFPEFGVHTDLGKAGHRIHLVDIDLARLFLHKEVHAGQTVEVQSQKGLYGLTAYLFAALLG